MKNRKCYFTFDVYWPDLDDKLAKISLEKEEKPHQLHVATADVKETRYRKVHDSPFCIPIDGFTARMVFI